VTRIRRDSDTASRHGAPGSRDALLRGRHVLEKCSLLASLGPVSLGPVSLGPVSARLSGLPHRACRVRASPRGACALSCGRVSPPSSCRRGADASASMRVCPSAAQTQARNRVSASVPVHGSGGPAHRLDRHELPGQAAAPRRRVRRAGSPELQRLAGLTSHSRRRSGGSCLSTVLAAHMSQEAARCAFAFQRATAATATAATAASVAGRRSRANRPVAQSPELRGRPGSPLPHTRQSAPARQPHP
jgi:hypothetical protein